MLNLGKNNYHILTKNGKIASISCKIVSTVNKSIKNICNSKKVVNVNVAFVDYSIDPEVMKDIVKLDRILTPHTKSLKKRFNYST